jgi:hypothetical protein
VEAALLLLLLLLLLGQLVLLLCDWHLVRRCPSLVRCGLYLGCFDHHHAPGLLLLDYYYPSHHYYYQYHYWIGYEMDAPVWQSPLFYMLRKCAV